MQIRWLRKALQNLNDEAEYIARENPVAAQTLVQRVFDSVNHLPDNPALGHIGRIHGTRELIVPNSRLIIPNTRLIIPYRVKPQLNRIEILRVFHTSRRLPKR